MPQRVWQVRQLHHRDAIRPYLEHDRHYAAYALGDLEPHLFPLSRWWLAEAGVANADRAWALILLFQGLAPPAVVCLGEPGGVGFLLARPELPGDVALVCRKAHLAFARSWFDLPSPQQMVRLVLDARRFRPPSSANLVRLSLENLAGLQALYAAENGAADAFATYQLAEGIFYGVQVEGELVSVAGTHLVAPGERIGAVGNVFTHPAYRRQGYAAACTRAVCRDLLAQGMTAVLNVSTGNVPALQLYRRLGFRSHCVYYEAAGTRKTSSPRMETVD